VIFSHRINETLELRLFDHRDAGVLFRLVERNREFLAEWLPWADHTVSEADVGSFIQQALEQHARNEGFHAGIWFGGELAGAIGIHRIDWNNLSTSIGYWLDRGHQGQGLVTAACRAVLSYLFDHLALDRVEIRCATGNKRSCAVPERLGFVREGVLRHGQRIRGRPVDLHVYSMLRDEWQRARTT